MSEKKKRREDTNPHTAKPFYLSQQFWYAVIGIAAITVLAALSKIDLSGLDISLIITALIGGRAVTHLRSRDQ